jgi:hypothetical protein
MGFKMTPYFSTKLTFQSGKPETHHKDGESSRRRPYVPIDSWSNYK